eukprot:scaffold74911_cov35-Tisochrysis_lutea.AAC.1
MGMPSYTQAAALCMPLGALLLLRAALPRRLTYALVGWLPRGCRADWHRQLAWFKPPLSSEELGRLPAQLEPADLRRWNLNVW